MNKYCFALLIFLIQWRDGISVQKIAFKSDQLAKNKSAVALSSCTSDGDCPEQHKCCTRVESTVCLPVDDDVSNLNEKHSKQAAVVDRVCPDGEKPLKNCYTVRCPYGYYCFYGLCCKHSKAGQCPAAIVGGGEPAGPSCDNDMECPWILKCCVINGNSRCVFPFNYVGGTVGISWPMMKLRQSNRAKRIKL